MSHQSSKDKWNSLTPKQQELLWLDTYGSRIIPNKLTGAELDILFKRARYEGNRIITGGPSKNGDSLGGDIPD